MIAWFAKNDVAANILLVIIMLAGAYVMLNKVPVDLFPEIEVRSVSVSVTLPSASPQEVEEGITIKIEEAVQDIEGIRQINSQSSEGRSSVTLSVEEGYEVRELLEEVKIRVDAITNFPVEAENLLIQVPQWRQDAIGVMIYGNYDAVTLRRMAEDVRNELVQLNDISQVAIEDVLPFEMSIEIPEWVLRKYDLTLAQVSNILRQNSRDTSAGNLRTSGGEIFIRSRGQAYQANDFANIPIITTLTAPCCA